MSKYWQNRFQILEDQRNRTAKQTFKSITPAFDQAQVQIEKELNAWYGRFAKNNEISLVEAKKLLNTRELKEFRWDVEEYIKYGRENALDQKWMKELENASARFHISRLEALKIRTQNAAERAFGNELDQIDEMVAQIYMDDYYHTAYEIQKGLGVGWDVSKIDQNKLDKILSKPWTTDKQTFSDRIWKSKTQLLDSLHTELTQMCILGKAPDEAIKNIARRMDVSKGQAGRLVMTEAAYFGSVAQKDCFSDLGVEKYEIIATLDSRTSEICQKMDGQVFDMKDFQAGVTAPPFHVWCRSCTAPWFEDADDMRAARDADGKTYYVPADMKYEDWKQEYVEDATVTSPNAYDKDQFNRYKKVLKENSPKTLKEFTDIKYNDSEKYEKLKYQYRTVNRYEVDGDVPIDTIVELDNAAWYTKNKGHSFDGMSEEEIKDYKEAISKSNAASMLFDDEIYYSNSRFGNLGDPDLSRYIGKYPVVHLQSERKFVVKPINSNDKVPRYLDTEAKFLEFVATKKKPDEEFTVTILSEKHICESCQGVVEQFKNMFPKSTVNIISGKTNFNKSKRGTKTYIHRKEVT